MDRETDLADVQRFKRNAMQLHEQITCRLTACILAISFVLWHSNAGLCCVVMWCSALQADNRALAEQK
jgi:hypothetical protein